MKWAKEQQGYEERIAHLEEELSVAQGVYVQLDEQKQENLLLKETIDRMRFEMDEMRANAALGLLPSGGAASAANTISKSLGAELMGKMKWEEEESDGEGGEGVEEGKSVELQSEGEGSSLTAVEHEDEDSEDEDVIQTIITRKKRVSSSSSFVLQLVNKASLTESRVEGKGAGPLLVQPHIPRAGRGQGVLRHRDPI